VLQAIAPRTPSSTDTTERVYRVPAQAAMSRAAAFPPRSHFSWRSAVVRQARACHPIHVTGALFAGSYRSARAAT
jgi:hypothetical protein